MLILAKLIGIMIISLGIAASLKPELLKQFIAFWTKEKRLYLAGILRIAFGFIILMAAPEAKLFWVVVLFGLICLAKGVLIFVFKPAKIKSLLKWWSDKPAETIRFLSFAAIAIGILFLLSL